MNTEEIKAKNAKLTETKEILKKEFFGIDSVIDGVIDSLRSWYLFPKTMRKPVVINLWGMTGCGKTSLVKRLCELLDLETDMMMYNLAKLDEDTSDEMEQNIYENVSANAMNPVFVLDEFQYAATIDKDGKENNRQTALKTIWELIDNGKLYSKANKRLINVISSISMSASLLSNCNIKVKDGQLVGIEQLLKSQSFRLYSFSIRKYFKYNTENENIEPIKSESIWSSILEEYVDDSPDGWLSVSAIVPLYDVYSLTHQKLIDINEFRNKLNAMNINEFNEFVLEMEERSKKGYYKNYSNSLIFVIGNIDEAYDISYNMNPDMDADLFNEMTKKLTMVDIKQALQKRFRNEQIARLGNIMFLYPSFSSSDFNKIIRYYLDEMCQVSKNNLGFDVDYDDSVVETIYNESVFPTQGTRPIMSGIYEIIETKIPSVLVTELGKGNDNISKLSLSFEGDTLKCLVYFADGSTDNVEIKHQMKIDDKRKNRHNETQAVTAVHESGHFLMYSKLFGKMPKKLVSNCVSSKTSGFMMPVQDEDEFMSRDDYYKQIQVDLAGYAAELFVFGEANLTSGASADIENATETASKMIRRFGMGPCLAPCVYTYALDSLGSNGCAELNDADDNEKIHSLIKSIIYHAIDDINRTFEDQDWNRMFTMSAEYLFKNTSIPSEKMSEIYNTVPQEKRKENVRDENYYRNKLSILTKSI